MLERTFAFVWEHPQVLRTINKWATHLASLSLVLTKMWNMGNVGRKKMNFRNSTCFNGGKRKNNHSLQLQKMAKKYLCIQCSSSCIERKWSTAETFFREKKQHCWWPELRFMTLYQIIQMMLIEKRILRKRVENICPILILCVIHLLQISGKMYNTLQFKYSSFCIGNCNI